ncbi:MAG: PLDc N-terminal domain-containing protein [Bdellovibrionota bacterium]
MGDEQLSNFESWRGILTSVLYLFAVFNCFRILDARRSAASTISWLWAHLAVPYLAVPLYWFIGRVRLIESQRKKQVREFEFLAIINLIPIQLTRRI